jgi:tetratricopeptide (TPR) repeat protein
MARRRAARPEASPRSGRATPTPANPAPSSGVTQRALAAERSPLRWRDAAIVAAVIFVLYAASAPRTVTLEDSGIFIMSSDVAGISHPPGYPIHSVLGKLFTLLPFGSVAFRVHLLSAFFGALTCGVLAWIADFLIASRLLAYVTGLAYGVSREFWAQAIIAEVYTLNAFFFFVAVALAVAYGKHPERRTLRWGAFVVGLGTSHHWPLFFLSFPGVLALLVPRRREVLKDALASAPFFLLGLLPYAYLLVRSNMDPAISFYGPLDSLERFLFFVLRSGYAEVDASTTAGWHDRLLFSGFLGSELAWQFTPLGGALAAFGFAMQWRKWPRHVALGLLLSFLGSTLLLLFLLRRDFGYLEQAVFKVYPLLPYGVMALWLGLGIRETMVRLAAVSPRRAEAGAAVIGAGVILASVAAHAKGNWRIGYTWARDYGQTVLGAVAENAIIITTADSDIGPIGYLNRVEHVRPDVEIYNDKGLVFSNRLFRPPAGDRTRTAAFRRLIDESDRPVYVTGELGLGYPMEDYGLFKKVLRRGEPSVTLDPRVLERCRAVTEEPVPLDMWTVDHRNVLLVDCGRLLGPLAYLSKAPEQQRFQEDLRAVTRHPYGKIGALEGLAERGNPDELLRWVGEAENLLDENTAKQARGRLLFIRGFIENRKGAPNDAVESFRRSIAVFPDSRNGAVLGLLSLYATQHRNLEYQRLRDTIFAGRGAPAAVLELDRSIGK